MVSNRAAWYSSKGEKPFQVAGASFPSPSPTEIVIKNQAVAVNPIDWKVQNGIIDYVEKFPFVLGEDVAGTVEVVGSEVKHVKEGDRVIGNTHALLSRDPKYGGFQLYSTVNSTFVARIPDNLDYNSAAVLPLAISTAASALFQSNNLGIPLPSLSPVSEDKVTVLWGGSSSVGALAIQLAKAAGITVITTASARNHNFVRGLGADIVFDYNNFSVVKDITTAIISSGKTFAGVLDCISAPESLDMCYAVLRSFPTTNKIVSLLPVDDVPEDMDFAYAMAFTIISDEHKHIGDAIWGDYVPQALAEGKLKAVPKAMVVGKGLEAIQEALAIQENGVSAKKVVVEL